MAGPLTETPPVIDASAPVTASAGTSAPSGLKVGSGYGLWALMLLLAINSVNFIDRTIVNILSQPIKAELHLDDWQIGLMGGLTFALFYATLGLPIARLAERKSRVNIIAMAVTAWSVMTGLCGLATNYAMLLLCRVGVGVGEAGCSPPAHSLISDYFGADRRATALSIFSLGVPVGALIGAVFGGWAGENFGWRTTIIMAAAPGLFLAVLAKLTLREPARGASEINAAAALAADVPSLMDVARRLFSRPTFWHVAAGATLSSFAGYGIGQFSAPYFMREFGLGLQTVGLVFGLIGGVSAGIGTLLGGLLTDAGGKRDRRWYAWVPAIGLVLSAPLYVVGYLEPDWKLAAALLVAPGILHYVFLGPSFAITHSMVHPRMRATSSAVLVLIMTLLGMGLGPLLVGLAGDLLAANAFTGDFGALCPGGVAPATAAASSKAACMQASATGIQQAIVACSLVYAWAGVHYLLAAKTLRRDTEA